MPIISGLRNYRLADGSGGRTFAPRASVSNDVGQARSTALGAVASELKVSTAMFNSANSSGGNFGMTGSGMAKNTSLGVLDGVLDTHNTTIIRKIYKDIYYHDGIGGAAVDLMSNLPFSDFNLSGINDHEVLKTYTQCVDSMKLKSFLPAFSVDYHVLGAFVGTLDFSRQKRIFTSIMPHNLDNCLLQEVPIYGMDPLIDLKFDKELIELIKNKNNDPRVENIVKALPEAIKQAIKVGKIQLDPANTLYIPRKGFSADSLGTSYFRRLLPIFLLEKALIRGTIDQAYRRQRAIMHIAAGDEDWEPTRDELTSIAGLFQQADADPVNAIVATRNGLTVQDLKRGDDFWKWGDLYEFSVSAKLRALGISDAFLNGEASLNTVEAAMSVFVEQLRAFRENTTRKIFYEKIFPAIAVANRFTKAKTTTVHGRFDPNGPYFEHRGTKIIKDMNGNFIAVCDGSLDHSIDNIDDITKYVIPTVDWHKQLKPEADQAYLEVLNVMDMKGIPVPLKTIAAAGGQDLNNLLNQLDADVKVRERIHEYKEQIKPFEPQDPNNPQGGGYSYSALSKVQSAKDLHKLLSSRSVSPVGLFNRTFDDKFEVFQKNGSGKRMPLTAKGKKLLNEKINKRIAEAAANLAVTANKKQVEEEKERRIRTYSYSTKKTKSPNFKRKYKAK